MHHSKDHRDCLTRDELERYQNNSLSPQEKLDVELHLRECELCRDAVAGFSNVESHEVIQLLKKMDQEYMRASMNTKNNSIPQYILTTFGAVAASVVVAVTIFYFMNKPVSTEGAVLSVNNIELSKDYKAPPPPATKRRMFSQGTSLKTERNSINNEKTLQKKKPAITELQKKSPVGKPNIQMNAKPSNQLMGQKIKTIEKKTLAEANIVIPENKTRYGYSTGNNVMTIQFDDLPDDLRVINKTLPSFQHQGIEEFINYIHKNLQYPKEAYAKNIEGTVIIRFTLERNGIISNVKLEKSVHPSIDREALRVIRGSPGWIPARVGNKPAKVQFSCPVSFVIE